MNKEKIVFAKKIIIASLVLLIITVSINTAYLKFIEPQKLVERKQIAFNNFVNNLPNHTIDYLFFGDSHIESGISPSYIDGSSFNWSQGGESYVEIYYILNKALKDKNVKINNIVLQVDPHTFSGGVRGGKFFFDQLYFYSKFIDLRTLSELKNEKIVSIYLKSKLPFLGNGKDFLNSLLKLDDLTSMHLGWTNNHTTMFSLENKGRLIEKTFAIYFPKNAPLFETNSFNYFSKTLEIAKDNNIHIIFLKYPLPSAYYSKIDANIDLKGYYDKVFSQADKILDNYITIDLHGYFFNHDEYYWDLEHLTVQGSRVFSEKMNQELKAISF